MHFHSTRNPDERTMLGDPMARGLASDGGLYLPASLPKIDATTIQPHTKLADVASVGLAPFFADDRLAASLSDIATEAYNFTAPLTPLRGGREPREGLELFHGPTAAFKYFGARV